jgi:hypothetical protein
VTPEVQPEPPMFDLRPVVCGYLRAESPDELEIAAWRKDIERYCREQDFRLETVFVDRRVPGDRVQRPGIGGLLGVLGLADVIGVVVPNSTHLSADGEALATLRRLILRTNSEVLCIEEDLGSSKADGA